MRAYFAIGVGLVFWLGFSTVAAAPAGDSRIRARAGKSDIVITTTTRLAGAIDSLTWDGKEFINSTDHGRQLQSACSFDNTPTANPETFNPTEAGSCRDHTGTNSTSRLLELSAGGNHLRTRTQMAFWLAPGQRSAGQLARNTNALSDYVLTKDVRIGYERWPQALDYRVTFTLPTNARHTFAQFEALTGYLPPEFDTFWQFNPKSGKLELLSDDPGEIKHPVVLATAPMRVVNCNRDVANSFFKSVFAFSLSRLFQFRPSDPRGAGFPFVPVVSRAPAPIRASLDVSP